MSTFGNLLAFSPELWLLSGAIVVFLVARLRPGASTTMVALVTLAAAFLALVTQFKQTITILDGAFLLDGFAIVIDVVVLAAAVLTLLASRADILPGDGQAETVPGFLLLATLGAMLAASAAEMVSLFLALELLAINLYVLSVLARRGLAPATAGLGYLVAGGASSALLLYGLALVFGLTGETRLGATGVAMAALGPNHPAVLLSLSLILGGFALRMGLLPVRWWPRGFESGVPLRMGLIRNHYVGRTFIEPQSSIRHFGVRVKLNPVKSILAGQRVILVDDSIVRGTTSRKIVRMVRAAGAKEVHVRISCPPTISPCFYGVDTPRKADLIAATHTLDQIRDFIEADSVAYLSLEGLLSTVAPDRASYCTSCYTGRYPVEFPRDEASYLQLALKLDKEAVTN